MTRVDHAVLERFARELVVGLGAPESTAERVAASLRGLAVALDFGDAVPDALS